MSGSGRTALYLGPLEAQGLAWLWSAELRKPVDRRNRSLTGPSSVDDRFSRRKMATDSSMFCGSPAEATLAPSLGRKGVVDRCPRSAQILTTFWLWCWAQKCPTTLTLQLLSPNAAEAQHVGEANKRAIHVKAQRGGVASPEGSSGSSLSGPVRPSPPGRPHPAEAETGGQLGLLGSRHKVGPHTVLQSALLDAQLQELR